MLLRETGLHIDSEFKCAVKDDYTLVDAIVETLKNLLSAVVALVPSSVAQIAGMGRKSQYHFDSSAALSGGSCR